LIKFFNPNFKKRKRKKGICAYNKSFGIAILKWHVEAKHWGILQANIVDIACCEGSQIHKLAMMGRFNFLKIVYMWPYGKFPRSLAVPLLTRNMRSVQKLFYRIWCFL
jgi:hypothetical protein